jgi:hypothetical protein
MKRFLLLFVFLLAGTYSCNQKEFISKPEVLHVPLGKGKLNASTIFESIDYLRLKGDGALYPSKVDQLEFINDEIFILDKSLGVIFKFSSDGNLLGTLDKAGEGPEEYQYLHRFTVDKSNQRIEVYDKVGQKIIVYDSDFKFISSFRIGLFFENLIKIGDKKYLVYLAQENVYDSEVLNNNLIVWNDGIIEYSAIPRNETDSRFQYRGISLAPDGTTVFLTQSFNDTIYNYSITEGVISDKIFVKFDNPIVGNYSTPDEIYEEYAQGSYSSNLDNLIVSDKVLSFNYFHKEKDKTFMMNYYFFAEKEKFLSSKGLYNDFDNFNIYEHLSIKDNVMINVVEPDYLSLIDIENASLDFQNSINKNLPLEDQMIVLFLKLKDASDIKFD